ncbi:MAG: hypothetical protein HQL66_06690 [Magnetococcales bacterium]|nr:hypothetical protein [Magnetococcales bacterium]
MIFQEESKRMQWELCKDLRSAVQTKFTSGEVACVKRLCGNSKRVDEQIGDVHISVETDISFLHGALVKIHVPGPGSQDFNRELADMIAIGTYKEDSIVKWRRMCLIQNKVNKGGTAKIETGQLILLSTFPDFTSKSRALGGGKRYSLSDMSGMLGAYGFFSQDGEMTVVSARTLKFMLGFNGLTPSPRPGPSLRLADLAPIMAAGQVHRPVSNIAGDLPLITSWPYGYRCGCPVCDDYFDMIGRHHYRHFREHFMDHFMRCRRKAGYGTLIEPEESVTSCLGMTEFVRSWTELRLGELVFDDGAASGSLSTHMPGGTQTHEEVLDSHTLCERILSNSEKDPTSLSSESGGGGSGGGGGEGNEDGSDGDYRYPLVLSATVSVTTNREERNRE